MKLIIIFSILFVSCGKKGSDKKTPRPEVAAQKDDPDVDQPVQDYIESCFSVEDYIEGQHFYSEDYFHYRAATKHIISGPQNLNRSLDDVMDIYNRCVAPMSELFLEGQHIE